MRGKKFSFITIVQNIFLTTDLFIKNDLITYASAGAYGFLLSVTPILMMILIVLIRFLHTTPDVLFKFIDFTKVFIDTHEVQNIIDSILSRKKVGIFEIIIGISIFWMARRFFYSVMQGIKAVFNRKELQQPIKQNLIVIAGEVLLVVVVSVLILILIAANSLIDSQFVVSLIPHVLHTVIKQILNYFPMLMTIFFIFLTYVFAPGTKPKKTICFISAAGCTLMFSLVSMLLKSFINMSRYNFVYGVFSNLIVLLLEVFIFFILFLFFAQFMYVWQFFDNLLLAQLYTLPSRDNTDPEATVRRMLFINPYRFVKSDKMTYAAGDVIFREGDETNDIFYIFRGTVELSSTNRLDYCERGDFFGELAGILNIPRTSTARAVSDTEIVRIKSDFFGEVLSENPEVSRRVVETISAYVRRLYGRKR